MERINLEYQLKREEMEKEKQDRKCWKEKERQEIADWIKDEIRRKKPCAQRKRPGMKKLMQLRRR